MKQQLVIGLGEVGRAVMEVLGPYGPRGYDAAAGGDLGLAEVLHICFPWQPAFVQAVEAYVADTGAQLVVVHSTVPVGTCDERGWVHSPVTGRHPHLAESIRTFVKYFGGERAAEAAAIFAAVGVGTVTTPQAATTEAGKLWELTQYGLAIVVEKQMHAYCEWAGIDYDVAYRQMATTYNEGYQDLGMPQFTRPVLQHMPGPIGGHCVVPGAELLEHWIGDLVADLGARGDVPRGLPAVEEVVA